MKLRTFLGYSIASFVVGTIGPVLFAQTPKHDPVLREKVGAAIESGLAQLQKQQKPDGCWSSAEYPGLTALIVQCFLGTLDGKHRHDAAAEKGLAFIRKNARSDGGLYAEKMGNYNTSVCLSTLLLAGDDKDTATIEAARRFLVGAQTKSSAGSAGEGGFGYESGGSGRQSRPDLDNTVFALEALRLYRDTHRAKEIPAGQDLNWKAAIDFVTRCQQLPATNKGRWVSDSADEKGGFVYTPDGGGDRGPAGEKAPRSYGTMTYAGVLSFIYADLKKDDPRVVAALDWLARHYMLEENPGQGAPSGACRRHHGRTRRSGPEAQMSQYPDSSLRGEFMGGRFHCDPPRRNALVIFRVHCEWLICASHRRVAEQTPRQTPRPRGVGSHLAVVHRPGRTFPR